MPATFAIVAASGRGSRFGGSVPKQYRGLCGRPVLRRALTAMAAMDELAGIRVAIHPDHRDLYESAVAGLDLMTPIAGGATRQDSVLALLESLEPVAPERVLIHDGARPLLAPSLARRVLSALDRADGAIAALPVSDTLKKVSAEHRVTGTIERAGLWRAQTPQAFHYRPLLDAHRRYRGAGLGDDAAIAEAAGLTVAVVLGAEENVKITTADDLAYAAALLASRQGDIRTGFGFDVHRFGPGDHVTLCGIAIPHDRGLIGHSDADVGLHALTDAVLGALGAGDIGQHFPPDDPRWRGADSAGFLQHAAGLVHARGGGLRHLDVTLVCERPHIAPYRSAMIRRVATLAGVEFDRVSVKATTTEGLGFAGRGEGIAAQAVATVGLPP